MNVKDVKEKFGKCLELVSMDPNFHNVSVGLFIKNNTLTVWSYSKKNGIEKRLNEIRNKMIEFGGLFKSEEDLKLLIPEGALLERPLKFLFIQTVEMDPSKTPETSEIKTKDNKSKLSFIVKGSLIGDKYVYTVSSEGEHDKPQLRIRAVVGGFMKYGECIRNDLDSFYFPDSKPHNEYVRVLLPYARNVSAVEQMLEASEQSGQMTTQTLGFSQ